MDLKSVKIIAVDFDGTLCENKWPEIGSANEELIEYLRDRQKNGDKLILWTCRVDDMLRKAIEWCKENELTFDAVNENLPEIIENFGSDTRKIFDSSITKDKLDGDGLLCLTINVLNFWRKKYIKTKDKKYWWQMIQLLPSSYNQKRTIMLNYEVLAGIYPMRKSHKLDEWVEFCKWIETLPYSEIIIGEKVKFYADGKEINI